MSADDQLDADCAVRWLRDMKITLLEDGQTIDLDKLQRYMLLKLVFRSNLFELKEKDKLL